MSDLHQCPRCTVVYMEPQACDWCPGEHTEPIPPKPAMPAECWNDTPVNADAAMDATRAMCGRSA